MRNTLRVAFAAVAAAGAMLTNALAAELTVYISYADWCGPCQVLMPKLYAAADRFSASEVELVTLDFTEMTADNLDRQFERAGPLSPDDFMEDGRFLKTGFAYLVVEGTVEGRVSAGMALEDIITSFRSALAR
jgi:thiol-disulfide isomerase/thioredoxin